MYDVFGKTFEVNLSVRCYLHIFSQLFESGRCYLKIFEDIMCFLGVTKVFFSPQSLICWISQQCSPYHQFDIVYDLLIPLRDKCIFLMG